MKDLVVIAGPNGAGKSTAARRLLPIDLAIREFVNADEIARGLSPFNPEGSNVAAARLMIGRIRALAETGESFAFETTLSGRVHVRLLRMCRARGYRLTLVFLWLPSPAAAIARVARRVAEGGHNVPRPVIVRRYKAGLRNLHSVYLPLVDGALIYDNSDQGGGILIAEKRAKAGFKIHDTGRWRKLEESSS